MTTQALARYHVDDPFASDSLALAIGNIQKKDHMVVICVGTDRSTGDSLGPLIGSQLVALNLPNIQVYGTLERPVHALNLQECLDEVATKHKNSLILGVDACLGKSESVGYISLKEGPLKPGTGVNKCLPAVGHYHLIGVVNVGGFMEYFVLQNTRLSLVMKMSNIICASIKLCFQQWENTISKSI